jgi:hypothetical protein
MAKAKSKVAIDETVANAELLYLREQVATLTAQLRELEATVASTYVTKAYVQTYIDNMLGDIMPVSDPMTENTSVIGYVPLDIEKVLKRFQNIGGTYTLYDYRKILLDYDKAAEKGNINPYIAVAQMVKEADWGRSWWSQRPRRNPAGIGVTGEKSQQQQPRDTWAFDEGENIWKKGYSFPSWEVSTQAHIGHLLAYAYTDSQLNDDQKYLVATDPRAKFIPATKRGKVKLLKDLDGNWAVPGIGYGRSIATLANALKK